MEKTKKTIRLIPCPAHDVSGMEEWLSDMAEKGWLLTKDGILLGTAEFEKKEETEVRYRLMASEKKPGIMNENGGEPDPEMKELSEEFSWEYVARRKDFFIFRTTNPEAVELNTDPEMQALTLSAVKKRKYGELLIMFYFLVIYPALLYRGGAFMAMLSMGSLWFFLLILLLLIGAAGVIHTIISLQKLEKQLKTTGEIAKSDYQKQKLPYLLKKGVTAVLSVLLIVSFFVIWGREVSNEGYVPINEYEEALPFATLRDMAGEGYSDYQLTMGGLQFETVQVSSDILAPVIIHYNEEASMNCADGSTLDAGLYVDYYEVKNEFLAKLLSKELVKADSHQKTYKTIEVDAGSADEAAGFYNLSHFPTVVIRKGNVVIKVQFYQFCDTDLPMEEWLPYFTER